MPKRSNPLWGSNRPEFEFSFGDQTLCLGQGTKIMGVLNVTPDSFSDGGSFLDPGLAERRALKMEKEGADLVDIGAESSRPGSVPVPAAEEIRRLRPVLKRLKRRLKIPISVDTHKFAVAAMALDEGAVIVNDIRALKDGHRLAKQIARYRAGVVLMHMEGVPRTMQLEPRYREVVRDVKRSLKKAVHRALDAGIAKNRILVDPGFGFGKTAGHNWELLGGLAGFRSLGFPLLAGLSRKSFLGDLLGLPVRERLSVSLAAGAFAIREGAHLLRVHDVLPHRQMAAVIDRALKAL